LLRIAGSTNQKRNNLFGMNSLSYAMQLPAQTLGRKRGMFSRHKISFSICTVVFCRDLESRLLQEELNRRSKTFFNGDFSVKALIQT